MRYVTGIKPDEACCSMRETSGELPQAPLEIWCMAPSCQYPGKLCLYVKKGGKRPQESE